MDSFEELLQITRTCGNLAVKRRNEDDIQASQKKDKSWVSNVDKELSDILLREIKRLYPQDQVISEEGSPESKSIQENSRQWYIDPIDGTAGFLKGNNGWAVQIGCVEKHRPVKGIVFQADTDRLFYAQQNKGAYLVQNGQTQPLKLHNTAPRPLSESSYTQSPNYADPKMVETFNRLGVQKSFKQGSLGMKLMVILEKSADFFMNTGGKTMYWDLAGPEAIFREAGGSVWDLKQQEIFYKDTSFKIEHSYLCFLNNQKDFVSKSLDSLMPNQ